MSSGFDSRRWSVRQLPKKLREPVGCSVADERPVTTNSTPTPVRPVALPPRGCTGHVVAVYPNGTIVIEHHAGMFGRRSCPVHGPQTIPARAL